MIEGENEREREREREICWIKSKENMFEIQYAGKDCIKFCTKTQQQGWYKN